MIFSENRFPFFRIMLRQPYFGRRLGSPPGLPGGGITGILPPSGVGARISGSTLDGGHKVPSDLASLSPSGSRDSPTVEPSVFVPVPFGGIGAQLVGGKAVGGAACARGVAGEAGACAFAALASISAQVAIMSGFMVMRRERVGPRSGSAEKLYALR
jgi:hypothetical protein